MSTNPFDTDFTSPTNSSTRTATTENNNPFETDFIQQDNHKHPFRNRKEKPTSPPNESQWNSSRYNSQQEDLYDKSPRQNRSPLFNKREEENYSPKYVANQEQRKQWGNNDTDNVSISTGRSRPPTYREKDVQSISSERRTRYDTMNKHYDDNDDNDYESIPSSSKSNGGWRTRYGANDRNDDIDHGGGSTFASHRKQRSRYRSEYDNDANDDNDNREDLYASTRFADEDGERQVDDLKQNIRNVKQDTLDSTRNALQTICATQETGGQTLANLNEQAGKLQIIKKKEKKRYPFLY